MNIHDLPQEGSSIYALGRDRPLSLQVPVGASVRALCGTVWLTQEGLIEDVVLAPGDRFEIKRKTLVVMNSVAAPATVYVEQPAQLPHGVVITPEHIAAIEAMARQLQRQEIARLLNLAGKGIMQAIRALKARLTGQLTPYTPGEARERGGEGCSEAAKQ